MTTALTVPGADRRDPAKASGRCRRAAQHYVENGFKSIGPSLLWAGYSSWTAREPTKNGYTHDWLLSVARYWNKGSQQTARAHLAKAIARLGQMIDHDNPTIAGQAAKTIIDVAGKEAEKDDRVEVSIEEQAKWMAQIRRWKRVFLRRGILIGTQLGLCLRDNGDPMQGSVTERRAHMLLAELDWVLGKGPRPDWIEVESEPEGITGPAPTADPTGSEVEAGAPTDEVLPQGLDEDEG